MGASFPFLDDFKDPPARDERAGEDLAVLPDWRCSMTRIMLFVPFRGQIFFSDLLTQRVETSQKRFREFQSVLDVNAVELFKL